MAKITKTKKPVVQEEAPQMFSNIDKHFFKEIVENQVTLILSSDITAETTAEIMAAIVEMNFYDAEDRPKVINLLIASPGGDMDATIGLINVIRGSAIPIRTIANGRCASAALAIFMSGQYRVVTPWSSLMSHQFRTGMEGTYTDLKTAANEFETYHEKMVDIFSTMTGLSKPRVESELLQHQDKWLSPQEAVDYGIADVVMNLG